MWKGKIKERKEKKKEKDTQKGRKKNWRLIFLLSVKNKREILKLIFNTII